MHFHVCALDVGKQPALSIVLGSQIHMFAQSLTSNYFALYFRSRYGQYLLYGLVHCLANGTFYFLLAAYYYTGAVLVDRGDVELAMVFRSVCIKAHILFPPP